MPAHELGLPIINAQICQQLGHVELLLGHTEEAEALLQAALDQVEHLRLTLTEERKRVAFVSGKLTVYEDLVQLHLARGSEADIVRAFAVVERAKSRALIEILSGDLSRMPTELGDPKQVAHLQSLRAQLQAVYTQLLGGTERDKGRFATLHKFAVDLEREIDRTQLDLALSARQDADASDAHSPRRNFWPR
ncbi:MAG: hypothetical protein HC853_12665 [Anaerolineae bacterium]|nr:hypothetical protein [Anaerolineae bacterium]